MNFLESLHEIETFIFDVDGVLTNSDLLVHEEGYLLRTMNTRDGFALKYAIEKGYNIIIITGGRSQGVSKRFYDLGIKKVYSGISDKLSVLRELVNKQRIDLAKTVYMGDDIPDYECMRLVLLATCPNDAVQEIKDICQYVSPLQGGRGCVRDIIEKVLKVQDKWFKADVVNL